MANLTVINGSKQSEMIRTMKHLLDMARSGRIVAIGFAVVQLDAEDGSLLAGTNAVWTEESRDALKASLGTLTERMTVATGGILH